MNDAETTALLDEIEEREQNLAWFKKRKDWLACRATTENIAKSYRQLELSQQQENAESRKE